MWVGDRRDKPEGRKGQVEDAQRRAPVPDPTALEGKRPRAHSANGSPSERKSWRLHRALSNQVPFTRLLLVSDSWQILSFSHAGFPPSFLTSLTHFLTSASC